MQVQYRNSNYIGVFEDYHRNGYGQLLMDNSQYIIGKWRGNKLHGYYGLLGDRIRGFGSMINNKLQGYNVISMRQSALNNKKQSERTIYGMFRDNKLYGKAILIEKQEIILGHYVSGELRQISDKKMLREKDVFDMLSVYFPNQPYSMEQMFAIIFKEARKDFPLETFPKFIPKIQALPDGLSFFGFEEVSSEDKWVGITLFKGQVLTVGEHKGQILQGIGRAYRNGIVEDGVFAEGNLNGIGIRYTRNSHKYMLGQHGDRNQQFEKGFGFPHKQVYEIRKQFHLRSINFYNDITLLPFTVFFQATLQNSIELTYQESPRFIIPKVVEENKKMRDSRSRGFSNKSPLRAKLDKYEEESDHIEEPSPIKNKKINQYQRVGGHRERYFESDRGQDSERGRDLQGKFNDEGRRDDYDDRKSSYSRKKVKDTRLLVKELDEKEKTRRDFLQKIYVQAGLTSGKAKNRGK